MSRGYDLAIDREDGNVSQSVGFRPLRGFLEDGVEMVLLAVEWSDLMRGTA